MRDGKEGSERARKRLVDAHRLINEDRDKLLLSV